MNLKDALQGGLKIGYFSEFSTSLGIELEANYFQPNMKGQNVTIHARNGLVGIGDAVAADIQRQCAANHSSNASCIGAEASNANTIIENQLSAKVKVLQFNLNAMYRYQEFKDFTPYIGGGPSFNIIKITGTGESGHFVDPVDYFGDEVALASDTPRVHDTSVNVGANFKVGAEYKLNEEWGVGAEYHYNWIPIDISKFRSANNLNADLEMQSLNFVLTKHF